MQKRKTERDLKQEQWDKTFLYMAHIIAARHSKDPSRKVGALIAKESYPLSFGYNGFIRGYPDSIEKLQDREEKLRLTIHAEVNAILNAVRNHIDVRGATLYSTLFPCFDCAKTILQTGIKRIVTFSGDENDKNWKESFAKSSELFNTMGAEIILYERSDIGAMTDGIL